MTTTIPPAQFCVGLSLKPDELPIPAVVTMTEAEVATRVAASNSKWKKRILQHAAKLVCAALPDAGLKHDSDDDEFDLALVRVAVRNPHWFHSDNGGGGSNLAALEKLAAVITATRPTKTRRRKVSK